MSTVIPTVTASNNDEYREQITVTEFSSRVHIDLADGVFATKSISPSDIWWPDNITADVHLMYEDPYPELSPLVALKPSLIILHAEAKTDLLQAVQYVKQHFVKVGLAVLQETQIESIRELVSELDHVLIFSGNLGSFGGTADSALLQKVAAIRAIKPTIEIGWDGGINIDNIRMLADGGIDVLNVGGSIQRANYPENAYRDLRRQLL